MNVFLGWRQRTVQVIIAVFRIIATSTFLYIFSCSQCSVGVDGDTKSVARRPSRKEGETGAVLGEKFTPADTTS